MTETILLQRRQGPVLVLTHNNPASRNALSPAFYAALQQALQAAAQDDAVDAIILTGEGGHFCSGGDLRQLALRRTLSEAERLQKIEALHATIRSVQACPKPVIAAVEGAAAGAGMSLALACDMLVAATNAVFSAAYVKVGLSPDGGATAFLAERVSRQLMTQWCLTGERISGAQLHGFGAVNRLAEPGQAMAQALDLAAQCTGGPHQAMAAIKALCLQAPHQSVDAQMAMEATLMAQAQGSEESREGIAAFLEKRPADFVKLRQPTTGPL